MEPITVLLFVVGLVLLVLGADWLVKGAARLAAALGITPVVIGLTVVAFGTSSPEMAVSVAAAWKGEADLAVGNVVGSNIFNVLFILGLSAVITPLVVHRQIVRLEVPLMVAASLLLAALAWDGTLSRVDAAVLFTGVVVYTAVTVRRARKEVAADEEVAALTAGAPAGWKGHAAAGGWVVLGLATLVLGSRWLVQGAVAFAQALGLSELVIGLTIVAAGTSLPEVATSVLAAVRGHRDIAVANVVGSNLFNILAVLGLSGLVSPAGIPVPDTALAFDIPVMIGVAVACLPVFFTGHTIHRWEGALFLGYYIAYTAFLVLSAAGHPELESFANAMLGFVLPLTAVTLLVLAGRAWHRGEAPAD